MKPLALSVVLVLCCTTSASTQSPLSTPDAEELLAEVVAQLPQEPLSISGELIVRKRHGVAVGTFGFKMQVNWGEQPATAQYTILDDAGHELEQLTVQRPIDAPPSYRYAAGSPLAPGALPSLTDRIQITDLTWMDLTLSFLWWKGARRVGEDQIKGRECHIVEVSAPDRDAGPYSHVRLWIDKELRMLLQAEALDERAQTVRRLWVRSCKKIDGKWMIKDMEVQAFPPVHRTKLRVSEVQGTPSL